MPTWTNMPRCAMLWQEQDVALYNQMPFWITSNMSKRFVQWSIWDKLTGTLPWKANEGNTVKGVRAEPTPITQQLPNPAAMTSVPKKNVMEVRETTETEVLYRHLFESELIHWLPSFADWRRDQVGFAVNDIANQITVFNDLWIRKMIFQKSPFVFISGATNASGGEFQMAPTGPMNDANTAADSKNLTWLADMASKVGGGGGTTGNLGLKVLNKVGTILREDIGAPFFEGAANMPTDGKGIAGKFVFVGSLEAHSQFIDDPYLLQWKSLDLDTPHDGFTGDLFGFIRYKFERYPLRMKVAGDGSVTIPAPEIMENGAGIYNQGETIRNPDYLNAQLEWGWMVGTLAYKTIRIGPPPKEFASGKMSESKFNKLQWNGEVRVTDNVLHKCLDEAGNTVLDTNKYGEFLQLIADVAMGILPTNRRYVIPVLYRRHRLQTN